MRVLVAEDDRGLREVLGRGLRENGEWVGVACDRLRGQPQLARAPGHGDGRTLGLGPDLEETARRALDLAAFDPHPQDEGRLAPRENRNAPEIGTVAGGELLGQAHRDAPAAVERKKKLDLVGAGRHSGPGDFDDVAPPQDLSLAGRREDDRPRDGCGREDAESREGNHAAHPAGSVASASPQVNARGLKYGPNEIRNIGYYSLINMALTGDASNSLKKSGSATRR